MKRADIRLALWGIAMIAAGIVSALLIDPPALRFLASVTAMVIGLDLVRQAFRIE